MQVGMEHPDLHTGHIPHVVLIQLTLLMMSTWLLETHRESKQIYIKGIVRQVSYLLELYRDGRSPEYKKDLRKVWYEICEMTRLFTQEHLITLIIMKASSLIKCTNFALR